MKYRFLAVLHNMELESIKNKGIELYPGARISNKNDKTEQILSDIDYIAILGAHPVDEFNDAVYIYIDGEIDDIKDKQEMDLVGDKYAFHHLREAQTFLHELWLIKDNNVYVRDGFLIAYDQKIDDGFVFKASLSEVYTYASREEKKTLFMDSEIISAASNFSQFEIENRKDKDFGGKIPQADHFYKSNGYTRLDRATYFVMGARRDATLPMKILSYCTALECLFTTGSAEITHKISERIATLLGTTKESRIEIYEVIRDAYKCRSKIVHGQHLSGTDEDLVSISVRVDEILRELLNSENEIFLKNDKEIDAYFIGLLFDAD